MQFFLRHNTLLVLLVWLVISDGIFGCKAKKKETSDGNPQSATPETADEAVAAKTKPLSDIDTPVSLSGTFSPPNQLKLVFPDNQANIDGYYVMLGPLDKGKTECSHAKSLVVPKELGSTIIIVNDNAAKVSIITACSFASTSVGWSGKTNRLSKPLTIKITNE